MATAVRASHLAVICLAFLHHLAGATTGERLLVHSRMNTTAAAATFPPHAPIHLQSTDAGRPTSSNSRHHLRALSPSAFTAPSRMAALLIALPLLAIPFLPAPVAAVVALSSLATPVRACSVPSDSCSGLTHGTCTVYRYHHDNATVDRSEPFPKLRAVCPPRCCDAGSDKRALSTAYSDCYCSVRTLEAELVPEGKAWRIMPVHLPVADPAAVVAAGGDVCYVEMEHMNYREGYYIRCPVRDCRHMPVIYYGWYTNGTARTNLHDEL